MDNKKKLQNSLLVLIACIGIIIVPAIAFTTGTNFKIYKPESVQPYKGTLPYIQSTSSSHDYYQNYPVIGFSPSQTPTPPNIVCENGHCWDANSTACGDCGPFSPNINNYHSAFNWSYFLITL
jgi:hypothetical protein